MDISGFDLIGVIISQLKLLNPTLILNPLAKEISHSYLEKIDL